MQMQTKIQRQIQIILPNPVLLSDIEIIEKDNKNTKTVSETHIAPQIFSFTLIHIHQFSSTFTHSYLFSSIISTFIHYCPFSASFINFHPISCIFTHFRPFYPLSTISSTFIHFRPFYTFSTSFIHCHTLSSRECAVVWSVSL